MVSGGRALGRGLAGELQATFGARGGDAHENAGRGPRAGRRYPCRTWPKGPGDVNEVSEVDTRRYYNP